MAFSYTAERVTAFLLIYTFVLTQHKHLQTAHLSGCAAILPPGDAERQHEWGRVRTHLPTPPCCSISTSPAKSLRACLCSNGLPGWINNAVLLLYVSTLLKFPAIEQVKRNVLLRIAKLIYLHIVNNLIDIFVTSSWLHKLFLYMYSTCCIFIHQHLVSVLFVNGLQAGSVFCGCCRVSTLFEFSHSFFQVSLAFGAVFCRCANIQWHYVSVCFGQLLYGHVYGSWHLPQR